MTDRTHPEAGSTHIIRFALELGLLWIDGSGRDKVREALDALDALEAQLEAVGAGGVQALSAGPGASRAAPPSTYVNGAGIHAEDGAFAVIRKLDARFHDIVTFKVADAAAASPTPPAEQQAAPKAAAAKAADSAPEDAALWFAERDNVLHSFWVLLGEAEVHADNDNNPLLKHQVEEFYRQWNALNGTTLGPRWVSRAARKQGANHD